MLSRSAIGFGLGSLVVGSGVGSISGEAVCWNPGVVGEFISSGESLILAVYSKTSLASLDPPECGTSSRVKPLEGAVMNVLLLLDVEEVARPVAGGRGPEGTRCCGRS